MHTQDQLEFGAKVAQEIMKARMFKDDYGSKSGNFEQDLEKVARDIARVAGLVFDRDATQAFVASLVSMVTERMQCPT